MKRLLPVCATLLAAAAAICWILFFEKARVYGHSMEPTLADGQMVLVDKLAYRLGEPERFDVIVFRDRRDETRYYMKRIVGLPGEQVQITDGMVFIDGALLEEPLERELIRDPRRAAEPVALGESEYFVLGDNRNDSSDSRDSDIGNIMEKQIIGRVVLWP